MTSEIISIENDEIPAGIRGEYFGAAPLQGGLIAALKGHNAAVANRTEGSVSSIIERCVTESGARTKKGVIKILEILDQTVNGSH